MLTAVKQNEIIETYDFSFPTLGIVFVHYLLYFYANM